MHPTDITPTIGFAIEMLIYKHLCFSVWDTHDGLPFFETKIYPLVRSYVENAKALMFVVDASADEATMELSYNAFTSLIVTPDAAAQRPLIVVANKSDKIGALSPAALELRLDIARLCHGRTWIVLPCCTHNPIDVQMILDWIINNCTG